MTRTNSSKPCITVAELFAGVGGFRLGLEGYTDKSHGWQLPSAGPYQTIWANQWEPGTDKKQFAARCYRARFGEDSLINEDIHQVLNRAERGDLVIPDVDMVVGGFPCQDYSVAKPLSAAAGIEGKKGVLWWDIYKFLQLKAPRFVLLENVDRLLKSPSTQRGRDFAIMLSCMAQLGYSVEWMVVNSGEYGFNQRRKRVYIFADKCANWNMEEQLEHGVIASAFPIVLKGKPITFSLDADPYEVSQSFNLDAKPSDKSPFRSRGVMVCGQVLTSEFESAYTGPLGKLKNVLVSDSEVPEEYFVPQEQVEKWVYFKGGKRERRVSAGGHEYWYSEGKMAFPDALDRPSRTILTSEGGKTPSRTKHIVSTAACPSRLRRLLPDELDQLQGFPKGWTNTGMTEGQRAFCMGNALVVGIPHKIGLEIAKEL